MLMNIWKVFLAEDYIIIVASQNDKNSKVEVYDDGKKNKRSFWFYIFIVY